MRILHTESSTGWGGQEIRILREAQGMRNRGHELVFAVIKGGVLGTKAKEQGFCVYEIPFHRAKALVAIAKLCHILHQHKIEIVNTHSSLDAWLGGIAARIMKRKIIRTRHLSTPTRKGINSYLLYKCLADFVVTTSSSIIPAIQKQSKLQSDKIACIPTGVDPSILAPLPLRSEAFRKKILSPSQTILVGTVCVVRSWKGIIDFMKAAQLVKAKKPNIHWVIIGGGYIDQYIDKLDAFGITDVCTFVGHIDDPYSEIAALDLFLLLSTANEGISQASLQAAYLEKPLVTTSIGGLPEVCLDNITGFVVAPHSPDQVADAVVSLIENVEQRSMMGKKARQLVEEKFLFSKTLDDMEKVYNLCE